jgi:hypothetical protein
MRAVTPMRAQPIFRMRLSPTLNPQSPENPFKFENAVLTLKLCKHRAIVAKSCKIKHFANPVVRRSTWAL